jgi:hypothetical protein
MYKATQTASHIHSSRIADVASISVLCARDMKGCFLPSFCHDIGTETKLVVPSVESNRRITARLKELLSQGDRAAEPTIRIKIQIVRAIMEGCRPFMVSMRSNVVSSQLGSLSLFFHEFHAMYESFHLILINRHSQLATKDHRHDHILELSRNNLVLLRHIPNHNHQRHKRNLAISTTTSSSTTTTTSSSAAATAASATNNSRCAHPGYTGATSATTRSSDSTAA